jgi:hypothetical protein
MTVCPASRSPAHAGPTPRAEPGCFDRRGEDDCATLVDGLLDRLARPARVGIDERRVIGVGRRAGDRQLDRFVHRPSRGCLAIVGGQPLSRASIIAWSLSSI